MRKFLLNEIEKSIYEMGQTLEPKVKNDGKLTCDNLEVIYNYLYGKNEQGLEAMELIENGNFPVSEEFFSFIKEIIKTYSKLPLLETESTIEYPSLNKRKFNKYEIIEFLNYLYDQEDINANFTCNDILVFNPSLSRRLTFRSGDCVFYLNSLRNERKLILEKYNSINDLIIPSAKSIQLITGNMDINSDLCQHFMSSRAIMQKEMLHTHSDDKKLTILNNDGLIVSARSLLLYLERINLNIDNVKWEDVNTNYKARIIHFINKVVGFALANNPNITLLDLLESKVYGEDEVQLDKLNSSYDEIKDTVKQKTLYLNSVYLMDR